MATGGAEEDGPIAGERYTARPMSTHLYATLLGPAWDRLHPTVQRLHTQGVQASGKLLVQRGRGLAWLLGALLRMPAATDAAEVTLLVRPGPGGQSWIRRFDDTPMDSWQQASGPLLQEHVGPIRLLFALQEVDGALHYKQAGWRLGPVPMPRWPGPQLLARTWASDGGMRVHVALSLPLLGLLLSYQGLVRAFDARAQTLP